MAENQIKPVAHSSLNGIIYILGQCTAIYCSTHQKLDWEWAVSFYLRGSSFVGNPVWKQEMCFKIF